MHKTVLAALPKSLLMAAASLGHDADALVAEAGIDAHTMTDPDGRITLTEHLRLWQALSARGPHIGLELGERIGSAALGVVGHAMAHAETLGEALACVGRYRRLVLDDAVPTLALERTADGERVAVLTQTVPAPFLALRHPAECQVTATLTLVRSLAQSVVVPLDVKLPHAPPSDPSRHEAVLGRRIAWSARDAVLVLDAGLLDRPLARHDARLFDYLGHRASALLGDLGGESLRDTLGRMLHERLHEGTPTTGVLAKRLGVSVRTLHRRLGDEGTTATEIIETIREARARTLLADASMSIGQVAYALGYTEHAAFTRAFKRWTGSTPEAFRLSIAR
jgi:AraC-like DNA-binding protein